MKMLKFIKSQCVSSKTKGGSPLLCYNHHLCNLRTTFTFVSIKIFADSLDFCTSRGVTRIYKIMLGLNFLPS